MIDKDMASPGFGGKTFDEWVESLTDDEKETLCGHFVGSIRFADGGKLTFWSGGETLNALPEPPARCFGRFYWLMDSIGLSLRTSDSMEELNMDYENFLRNGDLAGSLRRYMDKGE